MLHLVSGYLPNGATQTLRQIERSDDHTVWQIAFDPCGTEEFDLTNIEKRSSGRIMYDAIKKKRQKNDGSTDTQAVTGAIVCHDNGLFVNTPALTCSAQRRNRAEQEGASNRAANTTTTSAR